MCVIVGPGLKRVKTAQIARDDEWLFPDTEMSVFNIYRSTSLREHTDCEHDRVSQLDVVYVDSWNETDESWDDVGIVHIYRFGDGLESVQQRFRMLE